MALWLVIDLESTTEEGGWPVEDMEIIEIGVSLVTRDGAELDRFQRFVRPRQRPLLTLFCRELTHIEQADIDGAAHLDVVWQELERWIEPYHGRLQAWVSWGDYDRQQLVNDWRRLGIDSTLSQLPHINLKQRFAKIRQLEKPVGLNRALELAGTSFFGEQHRALTDARNTAKLLPSVLPSLS
ncbi:exonuclease domain-containing protein [Pseudomonas matsuisoli]|uniref:Exonuclease n=1 Tax=Pseudomonas matsuisoli TaxID=1515666 RepID=A0A917Q1U2_9PSED|nr:exonuclease domain-containing protein [Pseudomonas matsuisoli]GGK06239.1 exonuclease [Pseudomonas matsuisoli]